MSRRCVWALMMGVLVLGCSRRDKVADSPPAVYVPPLAVLQSQAYPETVTGRFVSLVDFEDDPDRRGFEDVDLFTVRPEAQQANLQFTVNITRTGAGAMVATLPPGRELVFTVPGYRDFSAFTLLSFSLHSEILRDDLLVRLTADDVTWRSHRKLLLPGWNTVLVDLRYLARWQNVDLTGVDEIAISFEETSTAAYFHLDDIMLVDNARRLTPVPEGMTVEQAGLDFSIKLPHRDEPIRLSQYTDGLWRLGRNAPLVQVVARGQALRAEGEQLELMGPRKVGRVEVLEHNAHRVRLANTWWFPTHAGEWISLAVRKIRWEYTFYADGRWVTFVEVNNSGGEEIGALRMWLKEPAAWSPGGVSQDMVVRPFLGPVERWSFQTAPAGLPKMTLQANHLNPGKIQTEIAVSDAFALGDVNHDRYDESRGCYFLRSTNGRCRFTVLPPPEGLLGPVFHIAGRWAGPVSVSCQGLAIRNITRLKDGSILFSIPGWIQRATLVEVIGEEASQPLVVAD